MEDWQILHIDRSLPRLIEITTVTTVLKTWLRGNGFITTEEKEKLVSV